MNAADEAAIKANHRAQAELLKRDDPVFTPGVVEQMPALDYFRMQAMSSSGAKKMLRSPAHYRLMLDTPSEPSDAMIFGSACHEGLLEPLTFNSRVVKKPKFDMRKSIDKQAAIDFSNEHAGRLQLAPDAFDRCRCAIDAVWAHPAAQSLLEGSRREVSAFWIDGKFGVPCKARFDALNLGGIIDLKTCTDASPETFARQAASFYYHLQAAAYNSGHEHALDASMQFFAFIVVESEPPYGVAVYELTGSAVLAGARLWNIALERYAAALKSGRWDGYPETIQRLEFPRWALTFKE